MYFEYFITPFTIGYLANFLSKNANKGIPTIKNINKYWQEYLLNPK